MWEKPEESLLQEHGTEVEVKLHGHLQEVNTFPAYQNNHAAQENHMINWSKAILINREPVCFSRWIKQVVHIRKEGQHAINRDEGSYQLSHAYDRFLDMASSSRVKNRKN